MFSPESTKLALDILQNEIPFAIWETVYVTIISTFLALVVGLPLGVLLVVGEKDGILPLPKSILSVLNAVINLLRSIPFLILMIMVFPVTRFFAHTVVGTAPTIVPLVFAAFPFVARLVEKSKHILLVSLNTWLVERIHFLNKTADTASLLEEVDKLSDIVLV